MDPLLQANEGALRGGIEATPRRLGCATQYARPSGMSRYGNRDEETDKRKAAECIRADEMLGTFVMLSVITTIYLKTR